MFKFLSAKNETFFRKSISAFTAVVFTSGMILVPAMPARAQYVSTLPEPGVMVESSPAFEPAVLKGLTIHPDNPLQFDFLVDRGEVNLSEDALEKETQKLIKYFLAAMTISDKEAWVNLSPYEGDRIIPDLLAATDMGKDMLEQDYLLKQISASMTNPEKELGKKFWDTVYKRAFDLYGITEVPINTFNKVWILPEKAVVLEQDGYAFIGYSRLKVMMDEDYTSLKENAKSKKFGTENMEQSQVEKLSALSSKIVKEIIIPELEKEVNEGQHFAAVRQIYNSVILAVWYKQNLKETLLGKVYADQGKIAGVDIPEKDVKQKVYAQYLEAFQRGVYNVIHEDYDAVTQDVLPRKYFSGGVEFGAAASIALETVKLNEARNGQYINMLNESVGAAVFRSGQLKRIRGLFTEQGEKELVTDRVPKPNIPASVLQARDEIRDLVVNFGKTGQYPKLMSQLLSEENNRRAAFINLLLAISLTAPGEDILDGQVPLPRSYFIKGNKMTSGDLNLRVMGTVFNILQEQEAGKILPVTMTDIINLQIKATERLKGQASFNSLSWDDNLPNIYPDGRVVIAYDAKNNRTYTVTQSSDKSTNKVRNIPGKISFNAGVLNAFNSAADFNQWLDANIAAAEKLSLKEQQLFHASLVAFLSLDADYENYQSNTNVNTILALIQLLGGADHVSEVVRRMDAVSAAQRQEILDEDLRQLLSINPDHIANAAEILGVQPQSPTVVVKQMDGGIVKIAYSFDASGQMIDVGHIIVATQKGFHYYSTEGDIRSMIDAFETPDQLIDFLDGAKNKINAGYQLGREYYYDAKYILSLIRAKQVTPADNERIQQFFTAANVETSPNLAALVDQWHQAQTLGEKRDILVKILVDRFAMKAGYIGDFFEAFLSPDANARIIRGAGGMIHVSQENGNTIFTIVAERLSNGEKVLTGENEEKGISDGVYSFFGSNLNLPLRDVVNIADIQNLIVAANSRKDFTSEQRGYFLQILLAINTLPDGQLGSGQPFGNQRGKYEPFLEELIKMFPDSGLDRQESTDVKRDRIAQTISQKLTVDNMDAIAKILGVTLNIDSVVKQMGNRTVEFAFNPKDNTTTIRVNNTATNQDMLYTLNGDWRFISFADNLSGADFQQLIGIVSQIRNITPEQQGQALQILAAIKNLPNAQFKFREEGNKVGVFQGARVNLILDAVQFVEESAVSSWISQVRNEKDPQKIRQDLYMNLLPRLIDIGFREDSHFQDLARVAGVEDLKPLNNSVASSNVIRVELVNGELVIRYNPQSNKSSFFLREILLLLPGSDRKASGQTLKQYDFSGDWRQMQNIFNRIGTVDGIQEFIAAARNNQLDGKMQSLILEILLKMEDIPTDANKDVLYLEDEYQAKVDGILKAIQSGGAPAGFNGHIAAMNSLSSLMEKKEYFIKTLLPVMLPAQSGQIDAIAHVLGINVVSQTLKNGEKITIQYNVATDTTTVSGEYQLASPRLLPFNRVLKGDWRNYSFADYFRSAEGLANALASAAKENGFTSYQQQNFMQIKQAASLLLPRHFSGEEESRYDPRVHKLLNLVSRMDVDAPLSAEARQVLFMAFKVSEDRDAVNNARRGIFIERFLPNLLKEKPGVFSIVAEILGVKLQAPVEESLSAEDIARYQERNLLQIQDAATEISLNEFTGEMLSKRVMTILLEFDLNSPMTEALTKRIAEVQNPVMRQRIFVANYLPALLSERPEVIQSVANLLGVELDAPVVADLRELEPVASSTIDGQVVNQTENVGGIDFDPSLLNLQIKRNGKGVALPLPQQNIDQIHIDGLYPVILNIQPAAIQDFPFLLSARTAPESADLSAKN